MQYRRFRSSILLASVLAVAIACHGQVESTGKTDDDCQKAIKHYEAQDIPDAEILKLFHRAETNGDVRATMWLARLHRLGRCGLASDAAIAEKMARGVLGEIAGSATKGDTEAQFLLGSANQFGIATPQNYGEAVKWYSKAVEGKHVTAMNNLGVMSARGHGTEPNIHKARALFSWAAQLGSKGALDNLAAFGEEDRDDTERLHALRKVPLVRALGMQKDSGITFLLTNGVIADAKAFDERDYNERRQYHFKADGIVIDVDPNGRIINVEGHAKGSRGSEQYKGPLPLELTWKTTSNTALDKFGDPDDQGYVKNDQAYGMAYFTENVRFVALFIDEPENPLKLWRVYEKWAARYSEGPSAKPENESTRK